MKRLTKAWFFTGLIQGLIMFLIIGVAFPYSEGEEITTNSLIKHFIVWIIFGLVLGYFTIWLNEKWPYKNGKEKDQ